MLNGRTVQRLERSSQHSSFVIQHFRDQHYGYPIQRKKQHPFESLRQSGAVSVDDRDRGHGAAHGGAAGWTDSASDREEQVDGAALAPRRQEVARAVPAAHAQ